MIEVAVNRIAGVFFIRTLLGLIFFMQGYGKVVTWGVTEVYLRFFKSFESMGLPSFLVKFTAYYTSYVELVCGGLLLLGLKTKWALYALGSVLLVVSFGHGLESPVWDLQHVIYRAILLIALLLLPDGWDLWSLDGILKKK